MNIIHTKRREIQASGLLPIATAGLAAAGVPPLSFPVGDLELGGNIGIERAISTAGTVSDMAIAELQLRIVRRQTWASEVKINQRAPSVVLETPPCWR